MEEKEKILRWNLQEAIKENNEPLPDFGGISIASVSLGVMLERENNIDKCRKELDEYLEYKKIEEYRKIIKEYDERNK